MEIPTTGSVSLLFILLAVAVFGLVVGKFYIARKSIWERQKKGLPAKPVAPGHSFLFGHLLFFKKALDKLPPNAHYQNALGDIAREYFQHEGCYYIDMWPVSGVLFIVVSPHVANQIHANPNMSMQRPPLLPRFFQPIAGGPNMFDMREHEWRPWRAKFNKAFSAEHVLSLVPDMIDETLVYSETLQKHSKEDELFYLDLTTLRFTIDVIGKTILYVSSIRTVLSSLEYADRKSRNAHLGAQRGYNALADCMLSQIRWHQANAETNPFEYFNLVRRAVHWWNGRQMDQYIDNELSKRLSESQADHEGKRQKAIIDLILQGYIAESQSSNPKSGFPVDKLDPSFRAFATSQIRLFVFAGHDSLSSTICYILHLLYTSPRALSRIRHEHDQVFGTDPSALASLLKAKPHLVNNLPYTTAVVKEALRLFPPGGCSRAGQPNVPLTSDSGKECPSANVAAVFTIHSEMQRSPVYWIRPDEFLPDRWLVKPEHELYPVKGAYRPFEIGPRNCVAQALAMTELKVVLACLVRRFDFSPAYEEFDSRNPSKLNRADGRTYRGERAYQIEEGAAHPADHYPCRVRIRKLV